MQIENKLLAELKPATYNPRQITTKQYNDLKESIEKFGLVDPIIINQDGTIIGGHQRYKIFKDITDKNILPNISIPCVVLHLSKEEERELNVRLNKNTGEFDMDILANEFDIDELVDWGFKHIDLDINIDKIGGNIEDDHIPEVKESIVKLGDVWELGKQRLMCGDSTKESDVNKLMNGQKADMVFTDPPYGMNLDTDYSGLNWGDRKGKKYEKVIGDNEDFKPELITTLFKNFNYCKEFFLWGADYYYKYIENFDNGHYIVWDKTLDSNGDAGSNSEFELLWTKQKHKRQVIHFNWFRYFGLSKQDVKKRIHPTQKPLQVLIPFIKDYSKKDNIIIDLYLGSGSTLIACEKTNRICYGMELDTKYCDVIIERWQQFTNQKATKCGV